VRSAVRDLDASRHRLVVAEDASGLGSATGSGVGGAAAAGRDRDARLPACRTSRCCARCAAWRRPSQASGPPELDDGLAAAVRVHPLTVALGARLDLDVARCDATTEAVLYAVCSEALGNIAKHAAASQVSVVHTVRAAGPSWS
jgi:hypothetical protein